MKKEKSPAFQFYPKDWLTDDKVLAMSAEVKGYYITLLCIDWLNDGFKKSDILKICGFEWVCREGELRQNHKDIEQQLLFCFEQHPNKPDCVTNLRLRKEREKQKKNSRERVLAGIKSGESRRKKAEQKLEQNANKTRTKTNLSFSSSTSVLGSKDPNSAHSCADEKPKRKRTKRFDSVDDLEHLIPDKFRKSIKARALIQDWLEHKKDTKRFRYTESGFAKLMEAISEWSIEELQQSIAHCIGSGYDGLHKKTTGSGGAPRNESSTERFKREMAKEIFNNTTHNEDPIDVTR